MPDDSSSLNGRDLEQIVQELAEELAAARKGRGLYHPQLRAHLGPHLRELLSHVPDRDGAALVREMQRLLQEAGQELAPDLMHILRGAFPLDRKWSIYGLQERKAILGKELRLSDRTIDRRIEAGSRNLAQALAGMLTTGDLWTVTSLRATMFFGAGRPRLVEEREITSRTYGLREVSANISLPPVAGQTPPDEQVHLTIEALAGCEVASIQGLAGYWEATLALPTPLGLGQTHRYVVAFEAPGRDTISPVYAFTPHRPCREFQAQVTFEDPADVHRLWLLDEHPNVLLGGGLDRCPPAELDSSGSVRVQYRNPRAGFSYGIAWEWAPGSPADGQ